MSMPYNLLIVIELQFRKHPVILTKRIKSFRCMYFIFIFMEDVVLGCQMNLECQIQ